MIDLHTHLLPYMDDGARDIVEAVRMTEELYRQNVSIALCTPHFDPCRMTLPDFINRRSNSMTLMGIPALSLILASETILHRYLFHYSDLSMLCITNTRYLLLELPHGSKWDKDAFALLLHLIQYYNLIPIIAHIERYPTLIKRPNNLKRLQAFGCVLQSNTSFVINKKTKRKALRYIKKGFIDVLGSDCHNMKTRPPIISEAVRLIGQRLGSDYCYKLEQNASCVLDGTEIRKGQNYYINN